jgi:hypothetical protein
MKKVPLERQGVICNSFIRINGGRFVAAKLSESNIATTK